MKHLGDITKIHGDQIPAVDVICGGSPCQDLSTAGLRAGLSGERSGLFMEQIRIIKEMRERDKKNGRTNEFCRPRFCIWENVPGAFSSGTPKGEDFRIVLEEFAKVCDPDAVIPGPPKGKWTPSGIIVGNGWSIAYRTIDSQFWGTTQYVDGRMLTPGTPQRRKRISLVADFGGYAAPEVLFEFAGRFGNLEPSEEKGKGIAGGTEDGIGETSEAGEDLSLEMDGEKYKKKFFDAYQHYGYRETDICGQLTMENSNHVRGDTPFVTYR